jgi:hypothetical protein
MVPFSEDSSLLPSSHQMQVQVKDILPAPTLHVEEEFVSGFVNTSLRGDLPCPEQEFGQQGPVFFFQIVDASDVFSWDEKDMNRGMGLDVLEGDQVFVLIDDICRLLSPGNSTENAFALHS